MNKETKQKAIALISGMRPQTVNPTSDIALLHSGCTPP